MAKKTKKYETTNNNQLRNIVKKTDCSNSSKFLVREKTRTRTYDTPSHTDKFLVPRFSYKFLVQET